MPRSARIRSTSHGLRLKTWYSHTAWLMSSAGMQCGGHETGSGVMPSALPASDLGTRTLVNLPVPGRRCRGSLPDTCRWAWIKDNVVGDPRRDNARERTVAATQIRGRSALPLLRRHPRTLGQLCGPHQIDRQQARYPSLLHRHAIQTIHPRHRQRMVRHHEETRSGLSHHVL